jgi:hypothetical protein
MQLVIVYEGVEGGASSHKSIEFALPDKVRSSLIRSRKYQAPPDTKAPIIILTAHIVGLERVEGAAIAE